MKPLYTLLSLILLSNINANAQTHPGYDVSVRQFQKSGDCVAVDYTVLVDPPRVRNCESVFLELYMEKEGNRVDLSSVLLNGNLKKRSYNRAARLGWPRGRMAGADTVLTPRSPGGRISYSDCIPYEAWMNGAALYMKRSEWSCGNNFSATVTELALLPLPQEAASATPAPLDASVAPAKIRESIATFGFQADQSVLDLGFGENGREWDDVVRQLHRIEKNKNFRIVNIEITGFASPEGLYVQNEALARERAQSVFEKLRSVMGHSLSPQQVTLNAIEEDWEGLARILEEDKYPHKEKVIKIIKNVGVFNGREKTLMELSGGRIYQDLMKAYFAPLRRVECRIVYEE